MNRAVTMMMKTKRSLHQKNLMKMMMMIAMKIVMKMTKRKKQYENVYNINK